MSELRAYLEHQLRHPLPGIPAQRRMAPVPHQGADVRFDPPPPNARWSAVLVLVCPDARILLTLRSNRLPTHSGQLSLPGGRLDSGEGVEDAALRETYEEVGIPAHLPQILGHLTPLYVPHSGNIIHPVVAWCDTLPDLRPSTEEVDEILFLPIAMLAQPDSVQTEIWHMRGQSYTVPFWRIHRVPLWGATAMILSEFGTVLNGYWPVQKPGPP